MLSLPESHVKKITSLQFKFTVYLIFSARSCIWEFQYVISAGIIFIELWRIYNYKLVIKKHLQNTVVVFHVKVNKKKF